jgi:hypothetical protein
LAADQVLEMIAGGARLADILETLRSTLALRLSMTILQMANPAAGF